MQWTPAYTVQVHRGQVLKQPIVEVDRTVGNANKRASSTSSPPAPVRVVAFETLSTANEFLCVGQPPNRE